jgi:hypothetical protein
MPGQIESNSLRYIGRSTKLELDASSAILLFFEEINDPA